MLKPNKSTRTAIYKPLTLLTDPSKLKLAKEFRYVNLIKNNSNQFKIKLKGDLKQVAITAKLATHQEYLSLLKVLSTPQLLPRVTLRTLAAVSSTS